MIGDEIFRAENKTAAVLTEEKLKHHILAAQRSVTLEGIRNSAQDWR